MNSKKRLAIISSHPIQYNAPLFQLLSNRNNIEVQVFYTWGKEVLKDKFDPGFGKTISWDIPLLEGYNYEFLKNISANPGSHHFKGIDNPEIIKLIEKYNPNAIMVYGWSFKSHLKALRYFKNKLPIIFRGDSTLLDQPKKNSVKKTLRYFFLNWVYKKVDYAIFCGSNNKEYFLKYGLKENQLVFGPHTIDSKRFLNSSITTNYKNQLNIKPNDFVFLFVGKFESKKNPLLLANAFCKLSKENCHLVFVGNGKLENNLKSIATNKINIHFLEFQNQSQMPDVYKMANFIVLPSQGPNETWGLVVNEAFACGIPAIVSNKVGCYKDLINDNITGFVFESGNEDSLILCLNKAIESKTNFKANCLNKIQDFSMENLANAIEDLVIEKSN